jgi:hypothetical protein
VPLDVFLCWVAIFAVAGVVIQYDRSGRVWLYALMAGAGMDGAVGADLEAIAGCPVPDF